MYVLVWCIICMWGREGVKHCPCTFINSLTAKCTFMCNNCTPRSPPSAHLCAHVLENQSVSHGYALCAPNSAQDIELRLECWFLIER